MKKSLAYIYAAISVIPLRAKPSMVLPEFLPFLMMSDRFMTRAVEISVGSLSPTINWTTLKHEEFALPPLDQQHRIAEILWGSNQLINYYDSLVHSLEGLFDAEVRENAQACSKSILLGEISKTITSGSRGWAEYYSKAGSIFIRIGNLQRRNVRLNWDETQRVSPPHSLEADRTRVQENDVLISVTAELGLVAIAESIPSESFINQHIAKVSIASDLYDPFLVAVFLSRPPFSDQFRKFNDHGATCIPEKV